jgi:predicted amidohydrolase YtcJ
MSRTTTVATIAVLGLALGATAALRAQQTAPAAPTIVLTNGKIVTVDDRFTIAQAAAIQGDRIVAVGSSQEIARMAGAGTRTIDLRGRTVIPGLIDNHMHIMRAGTTWQYEVRWDGVGNRKEALALLAARARSVKPGEWIYTLGGWTMEQFADNPAPFTRDELDKIAPNNPVFLQAAYYEAYLNSQALQVMGLDDKTTVADVERDKAGRLTGRVGEDGFRGLVGKLPTAKGAEFESSTQMMFKDLNRWGLTAFGSAGCEAEALPFYRRLAEQGRLNVRVGCITGVGAGTTPEQVEKALPNIGSVKVFQGNNFLDNIAFGESVYGPLHDPMYIPKSNPRPDQLLLWRKIATEVAKAGLPLHVHANLQDTISAFLDQIEAINREYPIKNLRWMLAHANQLTPAHLARMRELGVSAAVHPWGVINGGINKRVFGEAALDMAPLDTIQKSGVTWGFGSDGSRANQLMPFVTLGWAVTGKMVGGTKALRQPISREDALIAYTRKNAFFLFQESNLGSIQAGKLADLVVLDHDYLTVPADQIKDIKPVMTLVGGRVVYDAAAAATSTR